jgi:hypothetical protein
MWNIWGEKKCIQDFGGEPEGRGQLENLGIDGRKTLKYIFKN